ncbi:MAG: M20/M25/M40 family metallo-hydrolase [Candidatus Heimdallarchaeota archaeon]
MSSLDEMKQYVDEHIDETLDNLFRLIRLPTVTAKGGEYSNQAVKELDRIFTGLGFKTKVFPTKGQPVFTAHLDQGYPRTILFYDHYDVQPAEPFDLWDSPPFEPEVRDGKIYGRGVADNKGEIIVRASAIKMLLDLKGEIPVNIKFVIEGEEETSSPNLGDFTREHSGFLQADAGVWEFGGTNVNGIQQIWGGVKGICYVQLKTTGPKKDLHSANGTIVKNPANHLVAALASLRDDQTDRISIQGHYDQVVSPSQELLDAIERLAPHFDETKMKEEFGISQFINDLTGNKLLQKYYLEPTCTICGIWSGWQGAGGKTVLPAMAQAKIDFRLVPNQTPDTIIQNLKRHFEAHGFNIEIEWWDGYSPAYTDISHPFVQHLAKTMAEVYGHEPVVHPWSPGSGPLYLFTEYVPMLSIGVAYPGSNGHSPNENLVLEDFKMGQLCIARLLESMDKM